MPIYQATPPADVLLDITNGGSSEGTYLLTITNRGADADVSVAVTNGTAPTDASWIEYQALLKMGDVLARHPLPMPEGARLYVRASTGATCVTLIGVKE